MNPSDIQAQAAAWAQTPFAKNYYTAPTTAGTSGTSDGSSQYLDYLKKLINANTGNSDLQTSLLGYYLDAMNPQSQDTSGKDTDLQTALTLLDTGNPEAVTMANKILGQYYPDYVSGDTSATGGNGYYDTVRAAASTALQDMIASGTIDKNEYNWQKFLANASDQQIDQYDEASKSLNQVKWNPFYGIGNAMNTAGQYGVSAFNPFFNVEKTSRKAVGYNE